MVCEGLLPFGKCGGLGVGDVVKCKVIVWMMADKMRAFSAGPFNVCDI